jgi:hypothetical protein
METAASAEVRGHRVVVAEEEEAEVGATAGEAVQLIQAARDKIQVRTRAAI